MLSNNWNPPFSLPHNNWKECLQKSLKLISFLFSNHPGTYTDRGEKFWWQKHNLNLINYNLSNYIPTSFLHSKFILRLKQILWCIFEKPFCITKFFHQGHAGVKLTLQPAQAKDFSFKNGIPPDSTSHSFSGLQWGKTSKLKYWLS